MAETGWRNLGEATYLREASSDRLLIEHLSRSVAELNLPPAVLERVQDAVAAAIQRAWQSDAGRAARLTVAASVRQVQAGQSAQSWGFFLVEKRREQAAERRIDVLLYLEV